MTDFPTGTLNPKGRKSAAQKFVIAIQEERDFWREEAISRGASPLAFLARTMLKEGKT
jgi:hypothetical protein